MIRKMFFYLVFFLIISSISVAQQPGEISFSDESVMPEGEKGERIRSLIDTLNSNDQERIRRFLEEECTERFLNFAPMEEHIQVFQGTHRTWGKITFHSILISNLR